MSDNGFVNFSKNYINTETSPSRLKTITELTSFMQKDSTLEAVLNLLSDEDVDFLTITACYPNNTASTYLAYFSNASKFTTQCKLLNLQERFLIFYAKETLSYQLNPYLKPLFDRLNVYSLANLFKTKPCSPKERLFFITPPALNAYLTLLFKKPKTEEIRQIFTGFTLKEISFLDEINKNFYMNKKPAFFKPFIKQLFTLSFSEKISMLVAIYVSHNKQEVDTISYLIYQLLTNYKDKTITTNLLSRLYFYKSKTILAVDTLNKLLESPIFAKNNDNYQILNLEDISQSGSAFIENNFTMHLMPDSPTLLSLSLAFVINRYDTMSLYTINQDTFFKYLSFGFTVNDFIDEINRYKLATPPNFLSTLNHWQEQHESIQLYQGNVLKLSSDKVALLKQNDCYNNVIYKELAVGVYLLNEDLDPSFLDFLNKLGLASQKITSIESTTFNFSSSPNLPSSSNLIDNKEIELNNDPVEIDKNLPLELQSRLKRKVILFKEQLTYPFSKLEEVKAFDHQGKIRVLKSGIDRKLNAEIDIIQNIDVITYFIKLVSIEKKDTTYYLSAINYKNDSLIHLNITSLSAIRLLEASLIN